MDEFWQLSPAQVVFILNQNSEKKVRKGTAADLHALRAQAQARKQR